jgi:hypothetical protein
MNRQKVEEMMELLNTNRAPALPPLRGTDRAATERTIERMCSRREAAGGDPADDGQIYED